MDYENKLEELSKEVVVLSSESENFVINSDTDYNNATDFLAKLKSKYKSVEETRQFFVKPLNDHVKDINTKFKAVLNPMEVIEDKVKNLMKKYLTKKEEERKKQEEEDKRKRDEEAAKLAQQLKEEGMEDLPTFDEEPLPEVSQLKTIKSEVGKSTEVRTWKYKVIDLKLVPEQHKLTIANDESIKSAIKFGIRNIPGIEIYEDVDIRIGKLI